MTYYSYEGLKATNMDLWEEMTASYASGKEYPGSANELIDNALKILRLEGAIKESKLEEFAKETGIPTEQVSSIDSELERNQDEQKSDDRTAPGCMSVREMKMYLDNKTSAEEDKKFYEHCQECESCLVGVFISEIYPNPTN